MTRNLDLIRYILLTIENSTDRVMYIEDFAAEDFTPDVVSYHIGLLLECSYINAVKMGGLGQKYAQYKVWGLTSHGHDYLDAIKNDTVWSRTKNAIKDFGSSVSFEIIKSTAIQIISKSLGL